MFAEFLLLQKPQNNESQLNSAFQCLSELWKKITSFIVQLIFQRPI